MLQLKHYLYIGNRPVKRGGWRNFDLKNNLSAKFVGYFFNLILPYRRLEYLHISLFEGFTTVKVMKKVSQKPSNKKRCFWSLENHEYADCPDKKKHFHFLAVSRLFLLITSKRVLGTTTVTVKEKSRLRRKYYLSSKIQTMEQLSRLILWKHLWLQTAPFRGKIQARLFMNLTGIRSNRATGKIFRPSIWQH